MSFDSLWSALEPIGRHAGTGGYRRFAWTDADLTLREWFAGEATARGLELTEDRAGNQWAWWGTPSAADPGVVVGSHLDSVPDGGAFDGPLGVVTALCALDALREAGFRPARAIGVVNFGDEEGARFGVACAGSRLLTGALTAEAALSLRDNDGLTMAESLRSIGRSTDIGVDTSTVSLVKHFVELHVEQGRGLVHAERAVGVASAIWPHGRWRLEFSGQANHAGTTRLEDRQDPMLELAEAIRAARSAAAVTGGLATVGKVRVEPNGVNAIPSGVSAWIDARAATDRTLDDLLAVLQSRVSVPLQAESRTGDTRFEPGLVGQLASLLDDAPVLATGAGHDAGILAAAGVPAGMLFVRNPSGVSHSPAEFAERDDCLAGVTALTTVLRELAG